MQRILLLYSEMPPETMAMLRREAEVVGPLRPGDDWQAALQDVEAVITSSHFLFTGAVMDRAPRLWVIARPGIGVDNVDVAAATARGICVINTPDAPTQPVVEKVIGWLIMLAHRLLEADQVAREAGWQRRRSLLGQDLVGKTLGIVGLGRVGRGVAKIASGALQMRVLAYDPNVSQEYARQWGAELVPRLDDLLPVADFLSLNCPLTAQTAGLIGAPELRAMQPTAYLINAARGQVVDEAALAQALRERWIAGAAVDVFSAEPPPADHPLLHVDNIILAPHIGSYTQEGVRRMAVQSAGQTVTALKGQRPPHLVNPEVWEKRRSGG